MGGQEWYWVFTDHLGSITALLRESDGQKFEISYDACKVKLGFCECSETKTLVEPISYEARGREGNRRNPATWRAYTTAAPEPLFDRGFTGHEHLYAFNLINMNGRFYDPVLGRMLSPDNYVSSPGSTQAFNRYSYALNNPLVYADPSGDMPFLVALGYMAVQGIIAGDMAKDTKMGFAGGFAYGFAAAGLSQGFGALIGPVMAGPGAIPGIVNAGVNAAVSGTVTYGFDAIVNSSPFNWKGWALNMGMAMAVGGVTYQKPASPVQSNMLADFRAAGVELDLGIGYGMRFENPPGWVQVGDAEFNIPGTEIIAKPIKKQSWLTQFWYSEFIRMKVPDHFALSFGLNSTFIQGQSLSWSFNVLTRGEEPGFSITVTDQERIVGEIDWGFNLTVSRYDGNPMEINKASLEGKVKSISAAWGVGGEGYMGYNPSGKVIWRGASTGIGLSYGVSYGSGVTRQIWP